MTRQQIEKAREKACIAYDRLMQLLDENGHEQDCVQRCIEDPDCSVGHACSVCAEEGD